MAQTHDREMALLDWKMRQIIIDVSGEDPGPNSVSVPDTSHETNATED
jgi:hypothetical protein